MPPDLVGWAVHLANVWLGIVEVVSYPPVIFFGVNKESLVKKLANYI